MATKLRLFEIMTNTDKTEGKGSRIGTGIFFSEIDEAIDFVGSDGYKPFAVMGAIHQEKSKIMFNIKERYIRIYDSAHEAIKNESLENKERIKEYALKKLTDEEKEILGLEY